MKIKAFFLLTFFSFPLYSHNVKAGVNQPEIQDHFAPIEFSAFGMQNFLRNTYNSAEYVQEILPHSFDDMDKFIAHAIKNNLSGEFIKSVFKLFGNKVKGLEYINPSAFEEMLDHMNIRIKDYVKMPTINLFEIQIEAIIELLYQSFLTYFDQF